MSENKTGEIVIYQTDDGQTKIDVRFEDETVWLTQAQLVDLYQSSKANISEHIKHIFEEGELDEGATVRKFRTVQIEGTREVGREQTFYNLDMIISLGYRVKSIIATRFRRWATEQLKEYLKKGFLLNDQRLKETGGGNYWYELLDRIRDIRSSEKALYESVNRTVSHSKHQTPKSRHWQTGRRLLNRRHGLLRIPLRSENFHKKHFFRQPRRNFQNFRQFINFSIFFSLLP